MGIGAIGAIISAIAGVASTVFKQVQSNKNRNQVNQNVMADDSLSGAISSTEMMSGLFGMFSQFGGRSSTSNPLLRHNNIGGR